MSCSYLGNTTLIKRKVVQKKNIVRDNIYIFMCVWHVLMKKIIDFRPNVYFYRYIHTVDDPSVAWHITLHASNTHGAVTQSITDKISRRPQHSERRNIKNCLITISLKTMPPSKCMHQVILQKYKSIVRWGQTSLRKWWSFINFWCTKYLDTRDLINSSPPWAKWPPVRIPYFQMRFPEWQVLDFEYISLKIVLKGPIDNNPILV